ncbi:MAG: DUF4091 domain-containing protein [Thermoguttaceae bacterium]|nr:DUF4091 domain-containing protein [Thermoguttaceae bacterium]
MKNFRLGQKTLFAAALAALWLVGCSPLSAIELEMKPEVGTYADGVYEVSKTDPKSVRVYSKPFSVVPGGVYRFKMNACWFGTGGGCFPAGLDGLSNDYKPKESETPETLCTRVIRVWDNRDQARLSVGRWDSTKTIRFTEPQLVPVSPIYRLVREGDRRGPGSLGLSDGDGSSKGSFLALGSGEHIDGNHYTFRTFAIADDGNFARTLEYADCAFNSNRWCLAGGQSVVYRFDLRPIRADGSAQGQEDPLRFLSAEVTVNDNYHVGGRCVVELSADAQTWHTVGTLEEKGTIKGTAEELFASPVETLYVRCRAEETDSDKKAHFQIYGITLNAEVDSDRFTGQGETLFAEEGDGSCGADTRFEVTPLYRGAETLFCRVTNKTDGELTWPRCSYRAAADGGEPTVCVASVARTDTGGASVAAGESALFAVDLSNRPAAKKTVDFTFCFDREYRFSEKINLYRVQDYTRQLNAGGEALDLSWCEPDRKVPLRPTVIRNREAEPIVIAAPRNDFEGFQVVVRPKKDLADLDARSSDLTGPDGAMISNENIQVRWGYYHFVDTPTDGECVRGWYVDALVPMSVGGTGEVGAPLAVAAGDNQPIFVTVYVPVGTPKGEYAGALTITSREAGGASQTVSEIPYKLTVWDFDQPLKNRFETAYGFRPDFAFSYHNASDEPTKRAVWEKYLKSASDHRISLYNPTPLDGFKVTFDKENLKAVFDFTAFDAEMTRVTEKYNVTSFRITPSGIGGGTFAGRANTGLAGFTADQPQYDRLMASYLGQFEEHLREKGGLEKGYVYWFDEPEEKDYDYVAAGFARLKKYAPGLPRMLTEQPSDSFCDTLDAAGGNVDIWCPVSYNFSPKEAQKRVAKGERFWWYVCCGPKAPYCTEFTDHPAHELRLWHWQAFERGITGSLIWATNYWTSSTKVYQDPYLDPMCYPVGNGPGTASIRYWGNGDGRFFYPPLRASVPGRCEGIAVTDDPVESIRLEELREGVEDYEMLLTLRERFEAKKQTLSEDQRAEIEKIFDFSDLTTDMTHFTDDPGLILKHRARVAEAIVRLGE